MKLTDILKTIDAVAKKYGTSTPYCVGGIVRDKVLGILDKVDDLDLTTGDQSIKMLSQEFDILLKRKFQIESKTATDGHHSVFLGNFKIDFSSNFNTPNIEQILSKKGILNPTEIQKEMFSRDFTCNTLLMTMDLKQIKDPTNMGLIDIKNKVIRTCLAPEITLTTNRNRIIRAIYLSAKLDFNVDSSIIDYVRSNPSLIKFSSPKILLEKLNKATSYNLNRTVDLLNKMDLWQHIPITEQLGPYYNDHIKQK